MRLPLALAVLLLLPLAIPAGASAEVSDFDLCPADACPPEERAHGLLAVPEVGEPRGIVAILHGYGHKAESHRGHLAHLAAQGYVAFAMDYRGEGMPLRAGAEDTCAAMALLRARYPGAPEHLYSVSMGSAVAGMVLARCPGFSFWVDNEGMTSITETWAEAGALAPANAYAARAKADIEAECGGTPAHAPACYAERHALLRVPEFRGLRGVVLSHGLNDGLVPYDQSREMASALRAIGIPADFYTVLRGEACQEGTTLTGYAGVNCDALAGHGSESNDRHTLTKLSFRLLDEVLAGTLVPADQEHVVDEDLGTLP